MLGFIVFVVRVTKSIDFSLAIVIHIIVIEININSCNLREVAFGSSL